MKHFQSVSIMDDPSLDDMEQYDERVRLDMCATIRVILDDMGKRFDEKWGDGIHPHEDEFYFDMGQISGAQLIMAAFQIRSGTLPGKPDMH